MLSRASAQLAAIQESHRIFYCALCHRQVVICSRCDRGQMYCRRECAKEVRCRALRDAAARYQRTGHGALNHARRQERYRGRLREKVTHQGSPSQHPVRESEPLIVAAAVTAAETAVAVLEGECRAQEGTLGEEVKLPRVEISARNSGSSALAYCCQFCGRACGVFSRLEFLRERRR